MLARSKLGTNNQALELEGVLRLPADCGRVPVYSETI